MTTVELIGNPLNRPSATLSPTGGECRVFGGWDDSKASYWELVVFQVFKNADPKSAVE